MTLEQAKEYLKSLGLTLPDFVVEALLSEINEKKECLEANYSSSKVLLIYTYILSLLVSAGAGKFVANHGLSGVSYQGFRYKDDKHWWQGQLALLRGADPKGCVSDLIPDDPYTTGSGYIKHVRIYR